MDKKINVIITGATGMVGEGVLHECLMSDKIANVLVINRRPCGVLHPKLKELICPDLYNLSGIETQLTNYDACFFCLGISSVGMKEEAYYKVTYTLTLSIATLLSALNKEMVFCYISGSGTDSSEQGKLMWARVKGKTENDLMKLPFKKVYNFRPAIMKPTKGLKNTLAFYKYLGWLLPLVKLVAPKSYTTLKQLGLSMINAATIGYDKQFVEVTDILALAEK